MDNQLFSTTDDLLDIDPVHFVEKYRTIKGKPFILENTGRKYLIDFFHHIAFTAWGRGSKHAVPIVVVKGRQIEFTETMTNLTFYFLRNFPYVHILYAWPRDKMVKLFSSARLEEAMRTSKDKILERMLANEGTRNKTHKQFFNRSQLFIRSAWNEAESIRGVSANILIKDEIQEWSKNSDINTKECLAASVERKLDIALGTPNHEGSYFHELWCESDQRKFLLLCCDCKKYFELTISLLVEDFIIKCPFCNCHQEKMQAVDNGKWVIGKPHLTKKRIGFHLPQMLAPTIRAEDIFNKKEDYSSRRFHNEVLGVFDSGVSRTLVPADIKDMIFSKGWHELNFEDKIIAPFESIMGIDWGGNSVEKKGKKQKGFTVIVIIVPTTDNEFKIVFTHRFDTPAEKDYMQRVTQIKRWIKQFNSTMVVADHQFGHVEIQELRKEFGESWIKSCQYGASSKYNYNYDDKLNYLYVDRNFALEELLSEITKKRWIFPYKDPDRIDWFIDDLCNFDIITESRGGTVRKIFKKIDGLAQDALHALNYARFGLIIKGHILMQSVKGTMDGQKIVPVIASGCGGGGGINSMQQLNSQLLEDPSRRQYGNSRNVRSILRRGSISRHLRN